MGNEAHVPDEVSAVDNMETFYGDLAKHHASYRPILRLLRAPGRLVRATAVRTLLEKAERAGLKRVRAHCSGTSR